MQLFQNARGLGAGKYMNNWDDNKEKKFLIVGLIAVLIIIIAVCVILKTVL